ncbi:hypothetical protein PLES_17681 [Pseudomonas aeruginosa LESB58]|nr:hypothetical protein PLES_17681 [Pseudomonas aeruginosa LESB58]
MRGFFVAGSRLRMSVPVLACRQRITCRRPPHGPPRSCPGRRNTPSADQPASGTDPGIAASRRPRGGAPMAASGRGSPRRLPGGHRRCAAAGRDAQATGALRGPSPTSSVGRIAAASVNRDSSSSAQICDNSEYFSPRQWPELLPSSATAARSQHSKSLDDRPDSFP